MNACPNGLRPQCRRTAPACHRRFHRCSRSGARRPMPDSAPRTAKGPWRRGGAGSGRGTDLGDDVAYGREGLVGTVEVNAVRRSGPAHDGCAQGRGESGVSAADRVVLLAVGSDHHGRNAGQFALPEVAGQGAQAVDRSGEIRDVETGGSLECGRAVGPQRPSVRGPRDAGPQHGGEEAARPGRAVSLPSTRIVRSRRSHVAGSLTGVGSSRTSPATFSGWSLARSTATAPPGLCPTTTTGPLPRRSISASRWDVRPARTEGPGHAPRLRRNPSHPDAVREPSTSPTPQARSHSPHDLSQPARARCEPAKNDASPWACAVQSWAHG